MSFAAHFSRFLSTRPERLHFAAHSHHPWPDVSFQAQQRAWLDAATHMDAKWDVVFGELIPRVQRAIAAELALSNPKRLVFAPNTHELVVRLLSCLPERPRIVTTDAEFHSFERQTRRLEEEGLVEVERVATEPFDTFSERLVAAARARTPHLVFFSHVFFNSGFIVPGLQTLVRELPASAMVVIDGYHGFCAVPTSLRAVEERCFYLAGGYKYAMAGEGCCFLHVPPGAWRPRNTGWFAAFGALHEKQAGRVPFAEGAAALWGATFDPSGLYRLDAVMQWRTAVGCTTDVVREQAQRLQARALGGLAGPRWSRLVVTEPAQRSQFLTFRTDEANALVGSLSKHQVVVDARDDRLRVGFGPYQDEATVDAFLARVNALTPS